MDLLQLEACRGQQARPLRLRALFAIHSGKHQHVNQAFVQRSIPEGPSAHRLHSRTAQREQLLCTRFHGSARLRIYQYSSCLSACEMLLLLSVPACGSVSIHTLL